MIDVIDLMQSSGLNSLGRYIVAALLNARAGRTPMLSETNVRAMWNDLVNRGYYEPTAGIRWVPQKLSLTSRRLSPDLSPTAQRRRAAFR